MGMELMFPPDVAGWVSGEEWISTATVVERIKYADALFGGQGRAWLNLVTDKLPQPGDSVQQMVDQLLEMFDVEMPQFKRDILYSSAQKKSGGKLTKGNLPSVMHGTMRLVFGSPEFQFS